MAFEQREQLIRQLSAEKRDLAGSINRSAVPYTHADIAEYMGCSYSQAVRIGKELADHNAVDRTYTNGWWFNQKSLRWEQRNQSHWIFSSII